MKTELYRLNRCFSDDLDPPLELETITEVESPLGDMGYAVYTDSRRLFANARTRLVCYDFDTTKLLWDRVSDEKNTLPIDIDGNRAYCSLSKRPACVDTESGVIVWQVDTKEFPKHASDQFLFCIDEGANPNPFICRRKDDGSEVWRFEKTFGFPNLAAIENGILALEGSEGFHCLDETTGTVRWQFTKAELLSKVGLDEKKQKKQSSVGPFVGGMIYYGVDEGNVFALDARTGDLQWRFQYDTFGYPQAILVHEGKIYLNALRVGPRRNVNCIICLDTKTGEEIYRTPDSFTPEGAMNPIIAGHYIVGGVGRMLGVFDMNTHEFVWRKKFKEKKDFFGGRSFAYKGRFITSSMDPAEIYWFKAKNAR